MSEYSSAYEGARHKKLTEISKLVSEVHTLSDAYNLYNEAAESESVRTYAGAWINRQELLDSFNAHELPHISDRREVMRQFNDWEAKTVCVALDVYGRIATTLALPRIGLEVEEVRRSQTTEQQEEMYFRALSRIAGSGYDGITVMLHKLGIERETILNIQQETPTALFIIASETYADDFRGKYEDEDQSRHMFDEAMIQMCRDFQNNKKIGTPKKASVDTQLMNNAFNTVRQVYHYYDYPHNVQRGIQDVTPYLIWGIHPRPTENLSMYHSSITSFTNVLQQLGAKNVPFMDIRRIIQDASAEHSESYPHLERAENAFTNMAAVYSIRQLVDMIVEGDVKTSDILHIYDALQSYPFAERAAEVERKHTAQLQRKELLLDWKIIPRGKGSPHPRRGPSQHYEPLTEEQMSENERECRAKLMPFMDLFDAHKPPDSPNLSYWAYSNLPNLKDDEQYIIAVLVEEKSDGSIVEHAIADNPRRRRSKDRHALLALRAEAGNWLEVFRHRKDELRAHRVRFIKHDPSHPENEEIKIMEYLTRPEGLLDIQAPVRGRRRLGYNALAATMGG